MLVRTGGEGHFLDIGLAGVDGGSLLKEDLVFELENDAGSRVSRRGVEADEDPAVLDLQVDRGLGIGVLDTSNVPEGVPELSPAARLVGRHPTVVRLIVGIGADHQLDVRAVGVGEKRVLQMTVGLSPQVKNFLPGTTVWSAMLMVPAFLPWS